MLNAGYKEIKSLKKTAGEKLPQNSEDLLRRNLDRLVIEHVMASRERDSLPLPDTVRDVFTEGDPIYPHSGFLEKAHIQVCFRNLDCIKGVFRVPTTMLTWPR